MRRVLPGVLALMVVAAVSPHARALQTPGAAPVRVGGNIPPPVKTKDVRPVYPAEAQQARVSGIVILETTIGEDGKVRDVVVKRSIPLLDQAALNAVRQWEYTPTLVNGIAVPIIMTVTVNFTIQGGPPPAPPPFPPPAASMIRLTAFRTQDGATRVWEIGSERASSLPHWNPDTEMPSLTVVEAARIGRAWLAGRNPQAQRLDLQNVSLSRVRRFAGIDFWFYQLNFFGNDPAVPGPLVAVVLADGTVVESTESSGAPSAPAPPPASKPGEPRVYQPGGDVTAPRALREIKAVYTQEALRRKITGSVAIQGVVGVDGTFRDGHIIRSLDPIYGLDDEALKAAAQWQFAPGTRAGQLVPVMVVIEISFYAR
jgi:TonB family protein